MDEREGEILNCCLDQGENTWLSEYCFSHELRRMHKTIKRALKSLLEKGLIERKWGWYVSKQHGKIYQFYYRIGRKEKEKVGKKMETCTVEDKIKELCSDSLAWVSAEGLYPHLLADITEVHRALTELYNQKILDRKLGWYINLKGYKTYQWYYQKRTAQTKLRRAE